MSCRAVGAGGVPRKLTRDAARFHAIHVVLLRQVDGRFVAAAVEGPHLQHAASGLAVACALLGSSTLPSRRFSLRMGLGSQGEPSRGPSLRTSTSGQLSYFTALETDIETIATHFA